MHDVGRNTSTQPHELRLAAQILTSWTPLTSWLRWVDELRSAGWNSISTLFARERGGTTSA